MIYGERINRLEQALTLWEDCCFLRRIEAIHAKKRNIKLDFPIVGPIVHSDGFRHYLLNSFGKSFDYERYYGPYELWEHALRALFFIPLNLHCWVNSSRRVFHLTAEMQTMLAATSLEGIRWADLRWPVNSFVVTMDKPIADDRNKTYDCILVGGYPCSLFSENDQSIIFNVFGTDLGNYEPIRRDDRPLIKKSVERDKLDTSAYKRFKRWYMMKESLELVFDSVSNIKDQNTPVMDYLEQRDKWELGEPYQEVAVMMLRLVLGIILLSRTKEADKYIYSQEKPKPRNLKERRISITDPADLFLVTYEKFSTSKGRELVRKLGETLNLKRLRYHTRDGYWRRPRGKGHDPLWPKTKWVRPTEVNLDLKPTEGLPPSTRTVLGD